MLQLMMLIGMRAVLAAHRYQAGVALKDTETASVNSFSSSSAGTSPALRGFGVSPAIVNQRELSVCFCVSENVFVMPTSLLKFATGVRTKGYAQHGWENKEVKDGN